MHALTPPYRWITAAEHNPSWWPETVTDPRHGLAWARGSRQDGDGLGFAGADSGPALWVRNGSAGTMPVRMDAVAVCAAVRRGVPQDDRTIAAAGAAAADQLVIAANGYTTPLVGTGDDARTGALLRAVAAAADSAGAVPVVLHCPAGDALLRVLSRLRFVVGITDLYAAVELPGGDLADLLAVLPAKRRNAIRRELRALPADAGRIVTGAATEPFIGPAAELVAAAYRARGQSVEPAVVAGIYRRLRLSFGEDFLLCLAFAGDRPVASTCVLTARDTAMSYSAGFELPEAKAVAGYFNATYYLPIRHCYATGRRTLLLGPGTIEAKRLRGARFTPLYSAVPATCAPLAALLARTDAWHRRRMTELPTTPGGSAVVVSP